MELFREVLFLSNYNTRLVVLSTLLLGLASGLVGSFLLMRKRSLMGDALSHACLPGIGLMFLLTVSLGGSGKDLPLLLLGASISGMAGVWTVAGIARTTRLKDDAAMGIVLSVFFGLGVVVLGMVQTIPGAAAAGLESFIYGKTASMVWQDFLLISGAAVLVVVMSVLLLKEFTILCFDEAYASVQGWPVRRLDLLLLGLVALVTVVGLQAVGLVLIIAFLITPAASARFWSHDLKQMLMLSGLIGAASGWLGASVSALTPDLPAGAVIVLIATAMFVISLLFGTQRGLLKRFVAHRRLTRRTGRQHLLRAAYEIMEAHQSAESGVVVNEPILLDELRLHRSWSEAELQRLLGIARAEDHIEAADGRQIRLSEAGFGEAVRMTRNHRLWEIFLIEHADIAPSHVDRDADTVEHVLGADLVRRLEAKVARSDMAQIPASPHEIRKAEAASIL